MAKTRRPSSLSYFFLPFRWHCCLLLYLIRTRANNIYLYTRICVWNGIGTNLCADLTLNVEHACSSLSSLCLSHSIQCVCVIVHLFVTLTNVLLPRRNFELKYCRQRFNELNAHRYACYLDGKGRNRSAMCCEMLEKESESQPLQMCTVNIVISICVVVIWPIVV